MKHIVITIGCEYGGGGPEIGKVVAEALGIEYYDRDLVDKVVEKTGVKRDLVEQADQFDVIKNLAEKSSCVIIGRCSDYILKDRKDCLNIFIYAPKDARIKTIMEQKDISEKEATEMVEYYDELHHSRYKYMTGTYRGDRRNRHMMIDSSVLGWEETAKYILQLVELKFGN